MKLRAEALCVDFNSPLPVGIDVRFDGRQPNFFGATPARKKPLALDGFVGDTRRGGSCNVDTLEITPHCNGTHTECVGHVVDEPVAITDVIAPVSCLARVVTVMPQSGSDTEDRYSVPIRNHDRVITRLVLERAWPNTGPTADALLLRTEPNDPSKKERVYTAASGHPFISLDAVRWIIDRGISHLLVDTPSLERGDDGGHLAAHRLFWNVAAGSRSLDDHHAGRRSVTEMVYVPDEVSDGIYWLTLHIAPFACDAAPSRPVLYPVELL